MWMTMACIICVYWMYVFLVVAVVLAASPDPHLALPQIQGKAKLTTTADPVFLNVAFVFFAATNPL